MQTPKPPNRSRRKGRSHLPALPDASRKIFQAQIDSLRVSPETKQSVMASINAAANPDAESPDAVIASLETEDQRAVRSAMTFYARTMSRMNARGRAALLGMTDAEFERRLNDSE